MSYVGFTLLYVYDVGESSFLCVRVTSSCVRSQRLHVVPPSKKYSTRDNLTDSVIAWVFCSKMCVIRHFFVLEFEKPLAL